MLGFGPQHQATVASIYIHGTAMAFAHKLKTQNNLKSLFPGFILALSIYLIQEL